MLPPPLSSPIRLSQSAKSLNVESEVVDGLKVRKSKCNLGWCRFWEAASCLQSAGTRSQLLYGPHRSVRRFVLRFVPLRPSVRPSIHAVQQRQVSVLAFLKLNLMRQ
jgi:hypothetical protein